MKSLIVSCLLVVMTLMATVVVFGQNGEHPRGHKCPRATRCIH